MTTLSLEAAATISMSIAARTRMVGVNEAPGANELGAARGFFHA